MQRAINKIDVRYASSGNTVEEFHHWLTGAKKGDLFVYAASRSGLYYWDPQAEAMRRMPLANAAWSAFEGELVSLAQVAEYDRTLYVAERRDPNARRPWNRENSCGSAGRVDRKTGQGARRGKDARPWANVPLEEGVSAVSGA